ncbi:MULTISPECIES: LysR family transcriptional regulator [unclassified Nocardioides]|uniref:LysR family transcriptional regulator n=1 Tax=unclassified Nocardioides TaxID=2615069 RepID=UPI0009F12F12|nr:MULTISPECIES: LysR family transcriptional regulator [unclassified Nocardioides]GAW48961.1 Transcriptional regulator, LysR family [Nocardioides sp. PD653-B2]GAW55176.1 Transcriptional regulator, LysR family [Nocardioides sp. PD653]
MDLRQLTALVTVTEVGSITRGAHVLHLAQPTVTRQIQLLEDELGVTLLERGRQGVTLTPEGRVVVDGARRALHELDRVRAEIRPLRHEVTGIVRLGLLESVVDLLGDPLVRAVREEHPGIELRVLAAYSGHLREWLDTGDIDLSLLYNLTASPTLSVAPLVTEELWAVAAAGEQLPPSGVRCRTLLDHPLVLPAPGHGLRVLIDQALAHFQREPNIVVQVNSLPLQKNLVAAGHGWTILPASAAVDDVAAHRLTGAPLIEPQVTRNVVLGLPRGRRTPRAVEAVVATVTRVAGALTEQQKWRGTLLPSRGT